MRSIGHSSDHQHDKSSRQQQAQRPVPISIHSRERLLGKAAAPHLKIGSHTADYEHQGRRRGGPRQRRCGGRERDWAAERRACKSPIAARICCTIFSKPLYATPLRQWVPGRRAGLVMSNLDCIRFAKPYSNPSIDILAVVISVGHRISVRPFATATFCVPLTE